jgi:HPt (histidine-containing phosphotransfer) domain-containing protein
MSDVINKVEILDRVDGDIELLLELIDIFREDSSRLISEIRAAVSREDAARIEHNAHSLKGSVGNFGAATAYSAAAKLEAVGGAGDLSEAGRAFGVLETEIDRVRNALATYAGEISNENTRCGR